MIKTHLKAQGESFGPIIDITIPGTKNFVVSEVNKSNEHWTKKKERHDKQKFLIKTFFNIWSVSSALEEAALQFKDLDQEPAYRIHMTRISPRALDEDNLVSAFKWIKDAIADVFYPGKAAGRADDSKNLKWEYHQEKRGVGEYALVIKVYPIVDFH